MILPNSFPVDSPGNSQEISGDLDNNFVVWEPLRLVGLARKLAGLPRSYQLSDQQDLEVILSLPVLEQGQAWIDLVITLLSKVVLRQLQFIKSLSGGIHKRRLKCGEFCSCVSG